MKTKRTQWRMSGIVGLVGKLGLVGKSSLILLFLFLLTQRSKSTGQKSHPTALPFPSWSLYPFLFSFSLIVTVFSNSFLNQAHEQDIVSLSHRFSFTVEYSIFEAFQAKGTPFFLQSEWKECSVYIIKQNTDPCIHVHKTLTVSNLKIVWFWQLFACLLARVKRTESALTMSTQLLISVLW